MYRNYIDRDQRVTTTLRGYVGCKTNSVWDTLTLAKHTKTMIFCPNKTLLAHWSRPFSKKI